MPKGATDTGHAFTVERRNDKVIAVRFLEDVVEGWEQWCLLRADAHADHPDSDRGLQKAHLEEARERGAPIFDFGDFFCAMQNAHDPRASHDALRAEHMRKDYLNSLVESVVEQCAPYANLWALWAQGNHETGIVKHHGFDLTKDVARRMQTEHSGIGFSGGYRGWVQFMFKVRQSASFQKKLFYTHGRGGRAPATKGVAKTARRAAYLPDADIVVSGHIHTDFRVMLARLCLSNQGVESVGEQLHVQLPSYKPSSFLDTSSWESIHEMPPEPIGAAWLIFKYRHGKMHIDALRAA